LKFTFLYYITVIVFCQKEKKLNSISDLKNNNNCRWWCEHNIPTKKLLNISGIWW